MDPERLLSRRTALSKLYKDRCAMRVPVTDPREKPTAPPPVAIANSFLRRSPRDMLAWDVLATGAPGAGSASPIASPHSIHSLLWLALWPSFAFVGVAMPTPDIYTIPVPEDAAVGTTWDELHIDGAKLPRSST